MRHNHQVVYYVDQVDIPLLSIDSEDCPVLPGAVQMDKVTQNVLNNVDFRGWSQTARLQWSKDFNSHLSKEVIRGMFWKVVCEEFKAGSGAAASQFVEKVVQRIARAYVLLYLHVSATNRDFFFSRYSDGVAQAVLFSLFLAFPKSRNLFQESFCRDLLKKVTFSVTGITPSIIDTCHWKLNLGGGDVLKSASFNSTNSVLSLSSSDTLSSSSPTNRSWLKRKLLFSPVVSSYLSSKRYAAHKLIKAVVLRSLENSDVKESIIEGRARMRSNEISESFSKIRQVEKSFHDLCEGYKADESVRKTSLVESSRALDSRLRQVKHTGSREYSNYLTSLHILQKNNKNEDQQTL